MCTSHTHTLRRKERAWVLEKGLHDDDDDDDDDSYNNNSNTTAKNTHTQHRAKITWNKEKRKRSRNEGLIIFWWWNWKMVRFWCSPARRRGWAGWRRNGWHSKWNVKQWWVEFICTDADFNVCLSICVGLGKCNSHAHTQAEERKTTRD